MKIVFLHIYHFGVLQNCKITLEKTGFQWLFGENEAGKTTLMDFIRCILFGFPTKNQSQRRYEPKNGNRMGGKLIIDHPKWGIWTIERIEGSKVAGEVTIYNETGELKEEPFLSQLLDRMDQSLFQGAYCFGLDGLQKLDKLTSEELGNFLISTAISGDRDLLEIEQTFEKKQSELFKKAGKKPLINEKLEQLKRIEKSLSEYREKNENYQHIKTQKENLEKRSQSLFGELKEVQQERRLLKRLFELQPVLEKYKQFSQKLKPFVSSEIVFPENGINRFEQWKKEVSLLNGELQYIEERISHVKNAENALEVNEAFFALQKEIKQLFNKRSHVELLQKQMHDLEKSIDQLQVEEKDLSASIGETWGEKELSELSFTLSSLHEHEELLKQKVNIQERKRRLEGDLEESRVKLEGFEKEQSDLKARLLPQEEYERYEKEQNKKNQKNSFPLYAVWLPFISAAVLIWSGWSTDNSSVFYGGFLVLLLTGLMTALNGMKKKTANSLNEVQYTDQKWLKELENRKLWIQLEAVLAHENNVYLQIAKQLDYLEIEEVRLLERAESWAKENGYTSELDRLLVSGYVNSLYKLKELMKKKQNAAQKLQQMKDEWISYESKALQLSSAFNEETSNTFVEQVTRLHSKLEKQLQSVTERDHLRRNLTELLERKEGLHKQIQHIQIQIEHLWKDAGVHNEEEYYKKGKDVATYTKLVEDRDMLYNQLLSLGFSASEIEKMAEKITEQYDQTLQHLEYCENKEVKWQTELTTLTEDKAKLEWEMKKLLEDGSYSEHMHRFELLKEEWNNFVKKWASYRLAQHALQKVKEEYQQTKLPAVLKTSSEYFSKITEGEYQSIIYTETDELAVVKADGSRYYPHELSRGTAEQVYLSIRLAVAANAGPAGFPIFMDDIAVNFDEKRTRKTLSLIQEVALNRQVLYFTCHSHLESLIPSVPFIQWGSRFSIS
ncbi:AAA family ATPase [Fictibacillus nanhaiensis]|uniref:ATP-binding protein n=1 Tax=Fictibacillus nanhaiensis TaxID=742169 RepID=UPI001C95560B|nr:AAA family ATPase [Fictibacillus nanhaiensis]MBY6037988.1 AAA family ATPase [Fictibacillus nanhaiensis]